MTYRGHVKNGMIVLDPPAELPEGAEVTIQCNEPRETPKERPLLKYAGQATDLPADASRSVDRVLYGERSS
jgi:hypothetical protein